MDRKEVSPKQKFFARLFVYGAASFFTGSSLLIFLNTFSPFIDSYSKWKFLALFGLLVVWGNFAYLLTQRFAQKAFNYAFHYLWVPVLIFLPTPAMMLLRSEMLLPENKIWVLLFVIAGTAIGTWYGKIKGDKKRTQQSKHIKPEIDPSLKRVHDNLPSN